MNVNKKKATHKARIEMIEYAINEIKKRYKDEPDKQAEFLAGLEKDREDKIQYAIQDTGCSLEEIMNTEFTQVSKKDKEAYENFLEGLGVTDEDVKDRQFLANGIKKEKRKKKKQETTETKEESSKKTLFKNLLSKIKPQKEEQKEEPSIPVKEEKTPSIEYQEPVLIQENPIVEETSAQQEDVIPDCEPFDSRTIPSYVQYDIIPLPSNGQCYPKNSPLRVGRIAVAYLTAADENIITSPNMYAKGDLVDNILERKILDKRINVSDLCNGDRDAITLWLRETSYGVDFPIKAVNPKTGKEVQHTIKLNELKYIPFRYKGDDNGCFSYTTSKGDDIRFRILTHKQILDIAQEELKRKDINSISTILFKVEEINDLFLQISTLSEEKEEDKELLFSACDCLKEWCIERLKGVEKEDEETFTTLVTKQMEETIVSVNGKTDKEFIKNYVANMRAMEAKSFREYTAKLTPGVDMEITIDVPESEGGGSFNTFLRLSDNVFINI